jgi:uncharacterized protein YbjT (DUF2867 family)
MSGRKRVLITGATGYLGRALSEALVAHGHFVRGLVRTGSEGRLAAGVDAWPGDALAASSIAQALSGCDTLVQLVGTPHPAPWKQRQFEQVDAVSAQAAARAAAEQGRPHFVYVSVAQPAPSMKGYIRVRAACERELARQQLPRTILRPWYVLGEGHRWPCVLLPVYRLLEQFKSTREGALRLGLVTHQQMIHALVWAVENPPADCRVLDVPAIRAVPGMAGESSTGAVAAARAAR